MISTDSLYGNEFDNYYAIFLKTPDMFFENASFTKPKGKYLRAYCKGDYDKLILRYR